MKRYLFWIGILALSLGSLWVAPKIFAVREEASTLPVQLAAVEKGDIFSRIATTGTVSPVLSVTVSTQVSGTIKKLAVDVNSEIKAGELVARLDQDLFRAEVLQAEAKLEEAQANLARERAGIRMQRDQIDAGIAVSEALTKNLVGKYNRATELFRRQLISKEEFDSAKAEWLISTARLKESSARIDENKVKEAGILSAQAKVKNARAELDMARIRLKRSVIRTPIAGMVIRKNVEEGQTVAASLQSPPLVTVADLTRMKVDAWVDEADVGKVKVDQDVEFNVDSFPNRTFRGKVIKIKPSPEIQDNVVVYPTEIHVDNDDLALKPGMTANVTIVLARKNGVLVVPHVAMRVRPRQLRAVFPELNQGQGGRGNPWRQRFRGMSREQKAERRRRRFLAGRGAVWIFRNGKPERARIRFGALDAQNMEITEGLNEGDQVIVGLKASVAAQTGPRPSRRWAITRLFR